jgi:hypothetical protein
VQHLCPRLCPWRLWGASKLTRYACCHCLLQVAVQALLEAWPSDKEWRASLPTLASEVSQLGPNHRSALLLSSCPTVCTLGIRLAVWSSRRGTRPATLHYICQWLQASSPLQVSAVSTLFPVHACQLSTAVGRHDRWRKLVQGAPDSTAGGAAAHRAGWSAAGSSCCAPAEPPCAGPQGQGRVSPQGRVVQLLRERWIVCSLS